MTTLTQTPTLTWHKGTYIPLFQGKPQLLWVNLDLCHSHHWYKCLLTKLPFWSRTAVVVKSLNLMITWWKWLRSVLRRKHLVELPSCSLFAVCIPYMSSYTTFQFKDRTIFVYDATFYHISQLSYQDCVFLHPAPSAFLTVFDSRGYCELSIHQVNENEHVSFSSSLVIII